MTARLEPPEPLPAVRQGPETDRVEAISAFYRAEIRGLVNFLLWMGAGVADATDLAQESMLDLVRSWADVQSPRAWVRVVASRKYARSHLDETAIDLTDERNPLLRASREDIAAWEEKHEVLRLVAALPWRQRQVMAWCYDGYQPHEIAAELGITPEAVRASLKLARRALAALLGREEEAE